MAIRLQVTFDAADPPALAAFWGETLGYKKEGPPDGFDTWQAWAVANDIPREDWDKYDSRVDPEGVGPRLFFQRVPEPKTAKNRVHLDLQVSGGRGTPVEEVRAQVAAAVERAVAAGATRLQEYDEPGDQHWVVLQDPEGNEFCLH
jgi:catechol 2,3-dioxygenase-like lactoylglutathione lyase family enzyme